MTAETLYRPKVEEVAGNVAKRYRSIRKAIISVARSQVRPVRQHLQDHIYSWAGFGFISAASFVHSLFSGLLITGIGWFIMEWKFGELWQNP